MKKQNSHYHTTRPMIRLKVRKSAIEAIRRGRRRKRGGEEVSRSENRKENSEITQ